MDPCPGKRHAVPVDVADGCGSSSGGPIADQGARVASHATGPCPFVWATEQRPHWVLETMVPAASDKGDLHGDVMRSVPDGERQMLSRGPEPPDTWLRHRAPELPARCIRCVSGNWKEPPVSKISVVGARLCVLLAVMSVPFMSACDPAEPPPPASQPADPTNTELPEGSTGLGGQRKDANTQ